jgi:drug/metabolite transporter (DMT)-like permease
MKPVFIVALLALIGVIGDFFIKLAGGGEKYIDIKWFVFGALLYLSTSFGWFYVMKHIKFSLLGVVYSITTALLLVAIGVFYFHEKLSTYEIAGIIAAIIAVILLGKSA